MKQREFSRMWGKRLRCTLFLLFFILAASNMVAANNEVRDLLVDATVRIDSIDSAGEVFSYGSGFFIAENGLICTNFHVIEDHFRDGYTLEVQTNYGESFDAVPIVWNYERDWAVIQIEGAFHEQYIDFGTDIDLLDDIWAAGYPVTGNLKITEGTINAYQPDFMGYGQNFYDVSINFDSGNSGGPVINEYLEAIGIVVAYYTEARAMDFIIPIEEIVDELYWARYITGSDAFVPQYISGDYYSTNSDEVFYVTNFTGYEISYLYILDEKMVALDDWGEDLLGAGILPENSWITIDPYEYHYIQDQIDGVLGELIILAIDIDGDMYIREWFPDLDPWDIELTMDDIEYYWDSEDKILTDESITVTNHTGYTFEGLYLTDGDMLDSGILGENLLSSLMHEGMSQIIDPQEIDLLTEIEDLSYEYFYLIAIDDEGDYYVHMWFPGLDSWDIEMSFEDYESNYQL